ncbi:MAG: magnesium-translocating P-type ATPase, partial [Planctomycetes bacterium]|nr:magnesium-translocating P-type ATPase [Planctomycetota bacterium]
GYMLSTALASFFLPFLPLLPVQILLINLLADFPAMALAADSVDPELIQRPRRWDIPAVLKFMILFGLIGTISDLITFAILLYGLHVGDEEFRTGWFVVSIMTGLLIMLSVRTQRPFFRSQPGSLLLLAALGVSVTTLVLPMTPFNHYFGLSPLTWKLVAIVGTVSLIYAFMIEMGKLYFYRVRRRAATGAQLSQT